MQLDRTLGCFTDSWVGETSTLRCVIKVSSLVAMASQVRRRSPRALAAVFALSVITACGNESASAPSITYPGVDGHGAYLPLRGTSHDPTAASAVVSCDGCHGGTTFREFTCTGCHAAAQTDPIHSSLAGYVAGAVTSADCFRCHRDGSAMLPADHARYFPIGTASHPTTCSTCHLDPRARRDVTQLACVTCHEGRSGYATVHARVRDYPAAPTPASCLRCHADGQVDRLASHGRRTAPGGDAEGGGPGDGDHDTRCFTCHTMIPPPAAGRSWAQDWSQASCSACH